MSPRLVNRQIIALAGAAALSGCASASQTRAETAAFEDARASVLQALADPASASFGPFSHGAGAFICGSVDAGRGKGGSAGAQPFVFSPSVPAADRLVIYDGSGGWKEKGRMAELFRDRGCTIGAEQDKALLLRAAIRANKRSANGAPAL
jgi:hypothetical protein